ncbi:hypothetical protein HELRODRAFT_192296 [Helobdella robusta]|uniref:Uncharacterized protein n=1 Tax=Helobdella robusta TaxID=6412 RepID=T1FTT0_HELRO|nr:hypothetical protein HELRODRAFT_192296 [Helobdella robusta]ESO01328.1 hypothetical protein HELRODRAFT_192296 [Helobdella robusta]
MVRSRATKHSSNNININNNISNINNNISNIKNINNNNNVNNNNISNNISNNINNSINISPISAFCVINNETSSNSSSNIIINNNNNTDNNNDNSNDLSCDFDVFEGFLRADEDKKANDFINNLSFNINNSDIINNPVINDIKLSCLNISNSNNDIDNFNENFTTAAAKDTAAKRAAKIAATLNGITSFDININKKTNPAAKSRQTKKSFNNGEYAVTSKVISAATTTTTTTPTTSTTITTTTTTTKSISFTSSDVNVMRKRGNKIEKSSELLKYLLPDSKDKTAAFHDKSDKDKIVAFPNGVKPNEILEWFDSNYNNNNCYNHYNSNDNGEDDSNFVNVSGADVNSNSCSTDRFKSNSNRENIMKDYTNNLNNNNNNLDNSNINLNNNTNNINSDAKMSKRGLRNIITSKLTRKTVAKQHQMTATTSAVTSTTTATTSVQSGLAKKSLNRRPSFDLTATAPAAASVATTPYNNVFAQHYTLQQLSEATKIKVINNNIISNNINSNNAINNSNDINTNNNSNIIIHFNNIKNHKNHHIFMDKNHHHQQQLHFKPPPTTSTAAAIFRSSSASIENKNFLDDCSFENEIAAKNLTLISSRPSTVMSSMIDDVTGVDGDNDVFDDEFTPANFRCSIDEGIFSDVTQDVNKTPIVASPPLTPHQQHHLHHQQPQQHNSLHNSNGNVSYVISNGNNFKGFRNHCNNFLTDSSNSINNNIGAKFRYNLAHEIPYNNNNNNDDDNNNNSYISDNSTDNNNSLNSIDSLNLFNCSWLQDDETQIEQQPQRQQQQQQQQHHQHQQHHQQQHHQQQQQQKTNGINVIFDTSNTIRSSGHSGFAAVDNRLTPPSSSSSSSTSSLTSSFRSQSVPAKYIFSNEFISLADEIMTDFKDVVLPNGDFYLMSDNNDDNDDNVLVGDVDNDDGDMRLGDDKSGYYFMD